MPAWIAFILTTIAAFAAEPTILGPITADIGIAIEHCHPGDRALIHVEPLHPSPKAVEGWFQTTNALLTLRNLTMVPDGTNIMEIRTVCRGMTSEVSTVMFEIRRTPPAPRVSLRNANPKPIPIPPLPNGAAMPLPSVPLRNQSYDDYHKRVERVEVYAVRHRSQ